MATDGDDAATRARALLDAHVAFEVARLTGPALEPTVVGFVDDVLDALAGHQVADLVDATALATAVSDALRTVPPSALVAGIVELVVDVLHEGPGQARPVSSYVSRDQVEALLDELLALSPAYERALDRLADSPLVGTLAARFMGRIVGEVVATNQEIANKVPGLGSLVSLGTSAASRVKGAADRPFEALLGASVGKGSSFAVRRLNRIVIDTLRDPMAREAALQAWDLVAVARVGGLGERLSYDETSGVVDAVHDIAVGLTSHADGAAFTDAVVAGFLDRFGGYTPAELLEQLDLGPTDLRRWVLGLAPGVVTELAADGDLERLVRARLAPFYDSRVARDLL